MRSIVKFIILFITVCALPTFAFASTELVHPFRNNHLAEGFLTFFDATDEAGQPDDFFFGANAYPSPVELTVGGELLRFSCSENAYHALKYVPDIDIMKRFAGDLNGFDGYRLSRDPMLRSSVPADWYPHKAVEAMLTVVRIKFADPKMQIKLLLTGAAYLVEHWPHRMNALPDTFWADGRDGTGKNVMGRILMQVRGEIGGVGEVPAPQSYLDWIAKQNGCDS